MTLYDELAQELRDVELAWKATVVVMERFKKFYEVLKDLDEHLTRLVAEEYPEAWQYGWKSVVRGDADDALYEALLYIFAGDVVNGEEVLDYKTKEV